MDYVVNPSGWKPNGTFTVVPQSGGSGLSGLTETEADMAVEFLNNCSQEIYQQVRSRLLWSRLEGMNKLIAAPYVEGGITIQHQSTLKLEVYEGRIQVCSEAPAENPLEARLIGLGLFE